MVSRKTVTISQLLKAKAKIKRQGTRKTKKLDLEDIINVELNHTTIIQEYVEEKEEVLIYVRFGRLITL